jgi:ribosomal protein L37AE/L43A
MTKRNDLESEFFNREQTASKHRHDLDVQRKQKKEHDEDLKALHHMKCSKCGHDLETVRMSYIDIDRCTSCGSVVLAPEDVDRFVAEESSILKTLIDFFKS